MYTIDNNINTLQDIVQHVWGLSQVEPAIFNNYCACIALRKDTTEVRVLPCFVEEDINQHCYEFLHDTVRDALTTGFSTKTCGNGLRGTMVRMSIKNDDYYVMLDKYLLTSDIKEGGEVHEQLAKDATGSDEYFEYARELYNTRPVITKQREVELISVMMHCMNELAARNILDDEVARADKIMNGE